LAINYQGLVEQPETLLKELCHLCGLEYESSMLKFHKSKRAVFIASVAQARKSVHQDAVGDGKKLSVNFSLLLNIINIQLLSVINRFSNLVTA